METKKINWFILIIYALYLNPIIIGSISTLCYLLIYGSALAYISLHLNYIVANYLHKLSIKVAIPIFWILISLMLSFVVPTIHGTNDYSYINVILAIYRKAIILVFLFLITSKQCEQDSVVDNFMFYYALASILYIFSTIFFAFIPSVKIVWQNVLRLSSDTLSLLSSFGYTYRFGWAGFAGFRNTIDCTTSLVFLIYLYADNHSKIKLKTPSFVVLIFTCFLGNMFYGRSGVIVSVICIAVGLTLYKKIKAKVVLSILVVLLIGIVSINVLKSKIPAVNDWYEWISTPFYNLLTTGSFNNYSANRLLNEMIFVPDRSTLLFGDGSYTDPSTGLYYMRTDSGFMRQILFWGVILTGIMYMCWLYSLHIIKRGYQLKLMLLIMCLFFEIKGEVYFEFLPLFLLIAMIDYRLSISSWSRER